MVTMYRGMIIKQGFARDGKSSLVELLSLLILALIRITCPLLLTRLDSMRVGLLLATRSVFAGAHQSL